MERRPTVLSQHRSLYSGAQAQTKSLMESVDGMPLRRRRRMNTTKTIKLSTSSQVSSLTSTSFQTSLCESKDLNLQETDANSTGYRVPRNLVYENEFHWKISNMIVFHGIQV